jgi:phage terminase small subunit
MAEYSLNSQQKIFCEVYAKSGNATLAAREAGYSENVAKHRTSTILGSQKVRDYLDFLNKTLEEKSISSIEQIQRFWTDLYLGKVDDGDYPAKLSDRIRASELLVKSKGGFLDKVALVDTDGKSLPTINLNFIKPDKQE